VVVSAQALLNPETEAPRAGSFSLPRRRVSAQDGFRAGQPATRPRKTVPRASLPRPNSRPGRWPVAQATKHRPEGPGCAVASGLPWTLGRPAKPCGLAGAGRPPPSGTFGAGQEQCAWPPSGRTGPRGKPDKPDKVISSACDEEHCLFSLAGGKRFVRLVRLRQSFMGPSCLGCLAHQTTSTTWVYHACFISSSQYL
jgi:hypothetical protein